MQSFRRFYKIQIYHVKSYLMAILEVSRGLFLFAKCKTFLYYVSLCTVSVGSNITHLIDKTSLANFWTLSNEAKSNAKAMTSRPVSSWISWAAFFDFSTFLLPMITLAPKRLKARAVSLPIPKKFEIPSLKIK